MRVTLQVSSGPHAGKRIVLSRGQSATFGRTPESDYQFADGLMSSRHFLVAVDGQGCRVRDLESRNGTYVDEKRIVERALTSGCVIRAGETDFTVTVAEVAPMAVVPAMPPLPQLPPGGPATPGPVSRALQPPNAAAEFFPAAKVAFPPAASAPSKNEVASAAPLSATKVAAPRERWRSQASRDFELALDDPDPIVRRNALLAAAWQGQRWVLDYCRSVAARPSPDSWDALLLLAILGQPEDLPRILAIGRSALLGPRRFEALGAYGHPEVMSDLMAAMEGKDAESALAAAAAFEKITGADIRAPSSSADAAPDSGRAGRVWQALKAKFPAAVRWCRGHDISRGGPPEILAMFDLESRWEACLRGRFVKRWEARRLDDEQLADALHGEMPS